MEFAKPYQVLGGVSATDRHDGLVERDGAVASVGAYVWRALLSFAT
jgi:hypothetical protein